MMVRCCPTSYAPTAPRSLVYHSAVTLSATLLGFALGALLGIALALIDVEAGIEDGQHVTVDVRGRGVECEVVRPPFVDPKTR